MIADLQPQVLEHSDFSFQGPCEHFINRETMEIMGTNSLHLGAPHMVEKGPTPTKNMKLLKKYHALHSHKKKQSYRHTVLTHTSLCVCVAENAPNQCVKNDEWPHAN